MVKRKSTVGNLQNKNRNFKESTANNLPVCITNRDEIENFKQQDTDIETCLWKAHTSLNDDDISDYVDNLKTKGYREDQALLALQVNNYNFQKATGEILLYSPKSGLFQLDNAKTIETICNTIIETSKYTIEQGRCFNRIQHQFPNYTIGEILDFYMANKLKIKRCIAKQKRQYKKLSEIPNEAQFSALVSEFDSDNRTQLKSVFHARKLEDEWTRPQVFSFFQALGMFGKDFTKIASFVGHKSTDAVKRFHDNLQHVL